MSTDARRDELLFARLLCDVMIPAELSEALRAQGYDVAEARLLPMELQQDDDAHLRGPNKTWSVGDQETNACTCYQTTNAKQIIDATRIRNAW
jgi:hypothetical protein